MNRWRTQRGDVPIGCLIGFVVAVVVGLIAIKAIPVIMSVGEFDKEMKAQTERASLPAHDDKYIRKNVLLAAAELRHTYQRQIDLDQADRSPDQDPGDLRSPNRVSGLHIHLAQGTLRGSAAVLIRRPDPYGVCHLRDDPAGRLHRCVGPGDRPSHHQNIGSGAHRL